MKMAMPDSKALVGILAYLAENRMNMALEASNIIYMEPEAMITRKDSKISQPTTSESQRLDCIYYDEPLGFEKDTRESIQRMKTQDPLKEVDLGYGTIKRITYISTKVDSSTKNQVIKFLKEFKDFFAWTTY